MNWVGTDITDETSVGGFVNWTGSGKIFITPVNTLQKQQ